MVISNFSNILRETSLCKGLNEAELTRLSEAGQIQQVEAETFLMREGEDSQVLFILLQGEVEILKSDANGQQRQVATQSSGAVIGEMGLFLERSRKASVRAVTPCKLFVFKKEKLQQLINQGDSLVAKIAINLGQIVSYKLETFNDEVIKLLSQHDGLLKTIENSKNFESKDALEKTHNHLLKKAEQLRKSQQQVENQLTFLDKQVQKTKLTRRVAEVVIALVAGGIVTLITGRFIGMGLSKIPIDSEQNSPSPASIPYIQTEEECKKRTGSIWHEGKCWDFSHNKDW